MGTSLIPSEIEVVRERKMFVVLEIECVAAEELVDVGVWLGLGLALWATNVESWGNLGGSIR